MIFSGGHLFGKATMGRVNTRAPGAAEYLNLATSTLAKMRIRGDGPAYFKLGRVVLYSYEELDRWLALRKRQSTSEATFNKFNGK